MPLEVNRYRNKQKQILCTLAAKASRHWHRRYGTWFQTVSIMKSQERLKNRIKTWTNDECRCRICKVDISQVGFI